MRTKTNSGSLIGIIFLIGMAATFLTSDSDLRELFKNLDTHQIEVLLEYLNFALGFLSLVIFTIYLFYRAATGRGEKRLREREESKQQIEP